MTTLSGDSNQARSRILSKLRRAQSVATRESTSSQSLVDPAVNWPQQEKRQRFISKLTANRAEIIVVTEATLATTIEELIEKKGLKRVAIGTQGQYHEKIRTGLERVEAIPFDLEIERWKSEMFNQIDAGITHVLAGISDTGALVIWPTIEEPRILSLVPPCHIAIIEESKIVDRFSQLIESQNWQAKMPTNVLLISGPSKTADIQQTLAYGAHGPSELIVIILAKE